eukprot:evm.model.NODE_14806_length_8999_cov_41.755638.1
MDSAEEEEAITTSTSSSKLCEYLRVLAAYRRQCEEQGKYREAKRAHQQLQRLFREEEARRCQEWLDRHALERKEMEKAHEQQVQEFHGRWAAFLDEQKRTNEASIQAMKVRHAEESCRLIQSESEQEGLDDKGMPLSSSSSSSLASFSSFSSSLSSLTTSSTSTITTTTAATPPPKFTRELLELRRKERCMVQQHEYSEANKIKKLADRLEAKECKRSEQGHTMAVSRKQDKLRLQQQTELQAFRARIATKRIKHERHRLEDGRKLAQRNRNLFLVLVGKQNVEATAAFASIRRELKGLVAGAAAADAGVEEEEGQESKDERAASRKRSERRKVGQAGGVRREKEIGRSWS